MRTVFGVFEKCQVMGNFVIAPCPILIHGILPTHPGFVCQVNFIMTLFLHLFRQVEIMDPFLALMDDPDLDAPAADQGWLPGTTSKRNIQPAARGICTSALCRRLMVETGFNS